MNTWKQILGAIFALALVACDPRSRTGKDAPQDQNEVIPEQNSGMPEPTNELAMPNSTSTSIQPGTPEPAQPGRPQSCGEVMDKFQEPESFVLETSELRKRFSLKKDLRSASKSGAFPSLVLSNEDKKIKFLKVFPKIRKGMSKADIKRDPSYLEIFQTCRLSKLYAQENLPKDVFASKFFVEVYEVGFFKALDPFASDNESSQSYYPYMLSQAVDNVTLTELATEPEEVSQKEALGFNLDTAPSMVLESILMQILIALKNPYSVWELEHNDLHPGNILLSKNEKADFSVDYAGKKMKISGPLVKIIDYGLGESKNFKQESSLNYDLWIKKRPFIQELNKFIEAAMGGKSKLSFFTKIRIGSASKNQDIRMFNLILRALKPILNARGSIVPDMRYCRDYDDCLDLMSQWWN